MLASTSLSAQQAMVGELFVEPADQNRSDWQQLEPGLELGIFQATQLSESGDSRIRILRIDPTYFEFRLLSASATEDHGLLTAKEWAQQYGLTAVINASMYQTDYLTSVSLMKTKTHVNNGHVSRDKAILAFDRLSKNIPLVKILDRQCEKFEDWKQQYGTFVQSIRMISCKGKNVWRPQDKKSSIAAVGMDQNGRLLFIHVISPYSTYDLSNILLTLPLQLSRAMYVEGGHEAQLYIHSGEQEYEFVGNSFGMNGHGWPVPNVIGIARTVSTP